MIGLFLVQLSLFHQDGLGPLDAAEGAQGLVELVDPRAQPLLIEELRARNGKAGEHRGGGKGPVQHGMRRAIAQQLEIGGVCTAAITATSAALGWPGTQGRQCGSSGTSSQNMMSASSGSRGGSGQSRRTRLRVRASSRASTSPSSSGDSDDDFQRGDLRRSAGISRGPALCGDRFAALSCEQLTRAAAD